MHRLLQGDVGSGKTVVAALAAAVAIDAGWQCALMAPTEILAEQHFRKLVGWLAPLGITRRLADRQPQGQGAHAMLEQVASGEAALVVGTHAVIQEQVRVRPARPGDHRRAAPLRRAAAAGAARASSERRGDGALEPHMLMMSATPIPRTLAMTLFADLDVSTIDELPPGRTPIVTKLFADGKRDEVIARIRDEVGARPAGLLGLPADRGVARRSTCRTRPRRTASCATRCPAGWSACCTAACRRPRRRR